MIWKNAVSIFQRWKIIANRQWGCSISFSILHLSPLDCLAPNFLWDLRPQRQPGQKKGKVSQTAEFLAASIGSGVPTSAVANGFKCVATGWLNSNLSESHSNLAVSMPCEETLWLEELFGFCIESHGVKCGSRRVGNGSVEGFLV